jgi:exportin-2 (importin alpha re-exporter)
LRIVEAPTNDLAVRQSAATLFKNFAKRRWVRAPYGLVPSVKSTRPPHTRVSRSPPARPHPTPQDEEGVIPPVDKDAIRSNIVRLMLASPPLVQRQLSDALAAISLVDFPQAWPTLLPELVTQLGTAATAGDIPTVVGVLETSHAVFERFRGVYDTDEVRGPLRVALDDFGTHLPALLSMLEVRLDERIAAGSDKAALAPLLHAMRTAIQVLFLLSQVDLPDVFEDKLAAIMTICHKYLGYAPPPAGAGAAQDDEAGPSERLQAAILDVVSLYNDKYSEDFAPFLDTFVRDTWGLLASSTSARMAATNMDALVTSAIRFLTSVAVRPEHAGLFSQEGALRAVLESIVLPNLRLRETELELFEDNPIDFIRGDIEGSDADTRRRTATDLLRALCKNMNAEVTPLCIMCIDSLLASYATDRARKEADKDAAVALVMAVAVKSSTAASGATAVNELYSLADFLRLHVLPELQPSEGVNERPIARAAAIKFVATFRTLFGRDELHSLLPLLSPFTGATSYVVHTYAAGAIERILAVRDKAADGSSLPRVSVEFVAPLISGLLSGIFTRMMRPDYAENEYLMRCVMRLVAFAKGRVSELSGTIIGALTALLNRLCTNPSNPAFNHMLFETIAALMRSVCAVRPESVADFEALLFPPFQGVLTRDVADFFPYVFQLLAELLELKPAPPAGEHSLTDAYKTLLPPVLSPGLWSSKGTVPAVTDLLVVSGAPPSPLPRCAAPLTPPLPRLQAYLLRGGAYIVTAGHLPTVLGIWQRLLSTKGQEAFSFAILNAMLEGVPMEALQGHLPAILQMVMARLQELKAIRVARLFVHTLALAAGLHSPALLEGVLGSFGPVVFASVLESIVLPMAKHVLGGPARREVALGLTRILCESALLLEPAAGKVWTTLLATVVEMMAPPPREAAVKHIALPGAAGSLSFSAEEEVDETGSVSVRPFPAPHRTPPSSLPTPCAEHVRCRVQRRVLEAHVRGQHGALRPARPPAAARLPRPEPGPEVGSTAGDGRRARRGVARRGGRAGHVRQRRRAAVVRGGRVRGQDAPLSDKDSRGL